MELLYFLEELRTPLGEAFFSLMTFLGGETMVVLIGLLFFWCINKTEGYYLLSIGLMGTVLSQFLKLWFRIPRPWVQDPEFVAVESARAGLDSYSFPSGHTQSSVGIFGGIARWNRKWPVRVLAVLLCVLVPLSRMYLGVHTLLDVGVSVIFALVMVFGFYPVVRRGVENPRTMRIFMGCLTAAAAGFLVFVQGYPFPADVVTENLEHGTKNAYTMLGCLLGLWLTYEVDRKWLKFDPRAVWWIQLLKLALGIIPVLAVKVGLKEPLYLLLGEGYLADGVRYFLLTAVAGCVWPLTFPLLGRLDKKKK